MSTTVGDNSSGLIIKAVPEDSDQRSNVTVGSSTKGRKRSKSSRIGSTASSTTGKNKTNVVKSGEDNQSAVSEKSAGSNRSVTVTDKKKSDVSAASSSSFDDPLQYCVSKRSFETCKKGELPTERDWYDKFYFHSMKNLRDSYGTALKAKMKYREQLRKLREEEDQRCGPRNAKNPDDICSDISNCSSIFRSTKNHAASAPNLQLIMDQEKRIEELLKQERVQKACQHRDVTGTKYLFFGGGCHQFKGYKLHSLEDPWKHTLNRKPINYDEDSNI